MVFLRSSQPLDLGPVIKTDRLTLRLPQMVDFVAWSALREISREALTPFEPKWSKNELSREAFRNRLRFYQQEFRDSNGYPLFIFTSDEQTLVGGITLSNVRRGVTQSCSLGYWIGLPYQNRGYMTEAVRMIQHYAFETLSLHRIEAASMPNNLSSIRVLKKCGFFKEGLARRYLCINGCWSDHFLFSFLQDDFVNI